MKPLTLTLTSIFITAFFSNTASAKLKIVTTTADLASIAAAVGGEQVSVSSIITGARDAHRIEAKPSYMSRTSSADMFIAVGLDLEIGYEKPIIDGSGNNKVQPGSAGHVYASEFAYVLEKPTGAVTRAQGDIHPYGNPHIWLDPYNGRLIAQGLRDRFSKVDKAHAALFDKNCDAFTHRLDTAMFGTDAVGKFGGDKLWAWSNDGTLREKAGSNLGGWAQKMAPLAGTPIVTYHRSLSYLAKRFRFKVVDELEPKPGLEPTPGHLASVIRVASEEHVRAIVQEPFFSTQHGKLVASRSGAKLVVIPQNVGQGAGTEDYIGLFNVIVDTLTRELR